MKSLRASAGIFLFAGGMLLVPVFFRSDAVLNNSIEILINALFGVSLNLLIGYTGLLSLGHCAFFALGSYATGLALRELHVGIPSALLAASLIAGLFGLVMGYLCTRVTKFYFAFLTLALSQIVYVTVVRWVSLTGGEQGLIGGIPKPAMHFAGLSLDISGRIPFYYFTVLVVCCAFLVCKVITDSPFGVILRCIRGNPLRVPFLGVNTKLYQVVIFAISGIFGALSGSLAALNINGCYAEHAHWLKGAEPIFMILIGGMKTFGGPVVGAAVLVFLNTVIGAYTRFSSFVLGAILIFLVAFARMGILDFAFSKWQERRSATRGRARGLVTGTENAPRDPAGNVSAGGATAGD